MGIKDTKKSEPVVEVAAESPKHPGSDTLPLGKIAEGGKEYKDTPLPQEVTAQVTSGPTVAKPLVEKRYYEKEVDLAVKKGWLSPDDADKALKHLQTNNRAAYDALLTITKK